MKTPLILLFGFGLAIAVRAQAPAAATSTGPYSPEQLDQLLAPIALYPDPLIALILPASTVPSDITLAARYLAGNGDPAGIDSQPWDPSVKGLTHYPDLLKWLDDNLQWTQSLGAAFAQQPADVMKSIQQLRARALAAGTLINTPQQQVVMDGDTIRIVPAQQSVIYLPQYDSDTVYDSSSGYGGPFITFGIGFPVGPWLGYECDWDDFGIWVGPWSPGWAYRQDWQNPGRGGSPWRSDPRRSREVDRDFSRPDGILPRPQSIAGGAPARSPAPRPRLANPTSSSRPDYRGWDAQGGVANPAGRAPSSSLYGGYGRGTETRASSERGQESRSAPVRSFAPAGRSSGSSPSSGDNRDHR